MMAMEKMTLLKLNRLDDLKTIDYEYRNRPDPAYKRAWEIVNDIEGYQPFPLPPRANRGRSLQQLLEPRE